MSRRIIFRQTGKSKEVGRGGGRGPKEEPSSFKISGPSITPIFGGPRLGAIAMLTKDADAVVFCRGFGM